MSVFHSYQDLRCSWPPYGTSDTPTVAATGEIPDIRRLEESKIQLGTSGIPASTLLSWLRVLTPGVSDDVSARGKLIGSLTYNEGATHRWAGQLTLHDADVRTGSVDSPNSLIKGDISLRADADATPGVHRHAGNNTLSGEGFMLSSMALTLGAHDPADMDGHLDRDGYVLHLTGAATADRLKELAAALPFLAGGLTNVVPDGQNSSPVHLDLTSAHSWREQAPRVWQDSSPHQAVAVAKSRRR
jgi:AsmA protein